MNIRKKGSRFELEVAKVINKKFKANVRRTPNSGGLCIKGDLIDLVGPLNRFHMECKFQQSLSHDKAMRQAEGDAPIGKIPVVINKRNFGKIYVRMEFDEFLNLIKEIEDMK